MLNMINFPIPLIRKIFRVYLLRTGIHRLSMKEQALLTIECRKEQRKRRKKWIIWAPKTKTYSRFTHDAKLKNGILTTCETPSHSHTDMRSDIFRRKLTSGGVLDRWRPQIVRSLLCCVPGVAKMPHFHCTFLHYSNQVWEWLPCRRLASGPNRKLTYLLSLLMLQCIMEWQGWACMATCFWLECKLNLCSTCTCAY